MQPDTDNTNPIPTAEFTQQHEQLAWQLRLKGWNQERIANHLGVDQTTVSRMLKRVRTRLAEEYANGLAELRIEQTEILYNIITEALQAWQLSKQQPDPVSPQAQETKPDALELKTEQQTAPSPPSPLGKGAGGLGTAGKPAYLRLALQALTALRALWGLEAPHKAEINSKAPAVKALIGIDMEKFRNGTGDPNNARARQQAAANV